MEDDRFDSFLEQPVTQPTVTWNDNRAMPPFTIEVSHQVEQHSLGAADADGLD
jgi:hypothetical protein